MGSQSYEVILIGYLSVLAVYDGVSKKVLEVLRGSWWFLVFLEELLVVEGFQEFLEELKKNFVVARILFSSVTITLIQLVHIRYSLTSCSTIRTKLGTLLRPQKIHSAIGKRKKIKSSLTPESTWLVVSWIGWVPHPSTAAPIASATSRVVSALQHKNKVNRTLERNVFQQTCRHSIPEPEDVLLYNLDWPLASSGHFR